MECSKTPGCDRIEVLMGYRVPPVDQRLKQLAPPLVAGVQSVHFGPQIESEPLEV